MQRPPSSSPDPSGFPDGRAGTGGLSSDSPGGRRPLISVVVVAHQRRQFLPAALRSLERQTLSPEDFQVVVLKDFDAPELDAQLHQLQATVVECAPGPLGEWIATAASTLHGDIVTFLDDDDAYEPGKLDRVLRSFREFPSVSYYHHAQRVVDGSVEEPSSAISGAPWPPGQLVGPDQWRRGFARLWREDPAFNLSSIAVRRDLLDGYPAELRRIQVSLSSFLFYAALGQGATLMLDPAPLTRYRRSEGVDPSGRAAARTAGRLSELATPRDRDAAVLMAMAAPWGIPGALSPLTSARARATLVQAVEGAEVSRREVARAVLEYARHRSWGALLAERPLGQLAILWLAAPGWAGRRWRRRVAGPSVGARP